ncbi:MAG TPA: NADH-quinone oxidoreductase subunit C [Candidatus Mcinerneyibacterium sp.]|nr:NADH-quinone oxidoreductase subunit C [Candidatus Mcinerneyibacterium sp.]
MNQNEIIKKIENEFNIDKKDIKKIDSKQFKAFIKNSQIIDFLTYLKNIGFWQLSLITAVDWVDDNKFEIVYNLVSWELEQNILVKTDISRKNPKITSVINIWPAAKYYEWDVNEYFGIDFIGNPNNGKELFLENWDGPPPMRKDFDPLKYSKNKFPEKDYKNFKMKKQSEVIE